MIPRGAWRGIFLLVFLAAFFPLPAEETIEAFTIYGEGILLRSDGTWTYSDRRGIFEIETNRIETPEQIQIKKLLDCRVTKVTDGDTFQVRFQNPPPGITMIDTVRLLGIDTPELNGSDRENARKAQDFTAEWVENRTIYLAFDRNWRGDYGRLLAYCFGEDGQFLNAELLKKGLARVYRRAPCSFFEYLLELENLAYGNRIGIWSGTKATANITIKAIMNDGQMEYVEFFNQDEKDWDISGWRLKDAKNNILILPQGTIIIANGLFYVLSGKGTRSPGPYFYRATDKNIWNNNGDEAILMDNTGKIIYTYAY